MRDKIAWVYIWAVFGLDFFIDGSVDILESGSVYSTGDAKRLYLLSGIFPETVMLEGIESRNDISLLTFFLPTSFFL